MSQLAIAEVARTHDAGLDALALKVHAPLEAVKRVYDCEFERLQRDARIRQYLPVLATRHVREILRTHTSQPA